MIRPMLRRFLADPSGPAPAGACGRSTVMAVHQILKLLSTVPWVWWL
jgi:hypothetical protein